MKKILKNLFVAALLFAGSQAFAAGTDDFIISVQTDNAGTSAATEFTIPTTPVSPFFYDYNVDCNDDGTPEATGITGDYTCDYIALGGAGTYTIRIEDNSGAGTGFPRIVFANGGDKEKILSVEQWGTGIWLTLQSAFHGATNLVINATDVPDLSNVESLQNTFTNAVNLGTSGNWAWDVSNVRTMNNLFNGSSTFNGDIGGWNTVSLERTFAMFFGADVFNQDIGAWDMSNVIDMRRMFWGATAFNQDISAWNVLIIDDNEKATELIEIEKRVEKLREKTNLNKADFQTSILRNKRTRFMSGTGAWNTGIFETHKRYPNSFISILDDDDEYLAHHLSDCVNAIDEKTIAIFQRLIWKNADGSTMNVELTKEKLTEENFFIGNPGIQGSNMFFKTQSIIEIGGFDETLPNTTDRDLMIRFLWRHNISQIKVIKTIGIIHYNHCLKKVNNDKTRKQKGLDLFYEKYKTNFSQNAYQKSLLRAKAYFNYSSKEER